MPIPIQFDSEMHISCRDRLIAHTCQLTVQVGDVLSFFLLQSPNSTWETISELQLYHLHSCPHPIFDLRRTGATAATKLPYAP